MGVSELGLGVKGELGCPFSLHTWNPSIFISSSPWSIFQRAPIGSCQKGVLAFNSDQQA